jgi:hypothetical protein
MADQQPSIGSQLPAIVADIRRWNRMTFHQASVSEESPVTATSGLPREAAPIGGLLARHQIALARFGTDVAAAGGIGPALAAGLDPADYPAVPGGVPQAWERARVYLGLYERYHELYQTQLAKLHHLMATTPAPGDTAGAPERNSRAARTDPAANIPAAHQNAVV